MWMEVHIYNATDMSQAGNIWVKDIMTTGQGDLRYLARDLENLHILQENSAEGIGSRRDCYWHYVEYVLENKPKNLVVQGRVQLEHSSHIVNVGIKATCLYFNPWYIPTETTKPVGLFGTMPQESWHPGKEANPDHIIQLNCGKVRTHASYKTTKTWGNFNN